MHPTTFIIGGCRSGKSRHALQMVDAMHLRNKLFIATCVPQDEEMRARVQRHQQERGGQWQTVQEPMALTTAITQNRGAAEIVLIDCLTLWISNLMLAHEADDHVHRSVDQLCDLLNQPPCPIVLVSNEVGAGIVPENPLARRFRDLVGFANQKVASACGQVIWMVAGIPVTIKPGR